MNKKYNIKPFIPVRMWIKLALWYSMETCSTWCRF